MSGGGDQDAESIKPGGVNPSHTLLGIPGARPLGDKGGAGPKLLVEDEGTGGSTSFGVGTRSRGAPLGARRPSKGVRSTLMGLGSVRLLNEPGSPKADRPFDAPKKTKDASVRSTLAGMPAISVGDERNAKPKLGSGGRDVGRARGTMMGMPAIATKSGQPSGLSLRPGDSKQDDQVPTVAISDDHILRARELASEIKEQSSEPLLSSSGGGQSPFAVRTDDQPTAEHEPVPIEVDEDDIEEFDPLAGMTGVQEPKVSSLMDEEVENLSAAVFGDEFAFDDEDLDDEEDDFFDDIEFPGAVAHPAESQPHPGDIPEDEVHHDVEAAGAALADMMLDLEDVMPTEEEAAAGLGLDEEKVAAAHAAAAAEETAAATAPAGQPADDFEDAPTIADANVAAMMASLGDRVAVEKERPVAPEVKQRPIRKKPGIGAGGMLAIVGAVACFAWLFIPTAGSMGITQLASLDVASQVLAIFSLVAGILAVVTALMKLPAGSKGLVLGVLGVGLGALSFSAPVLSGQVTAFVVYAAAGLLLVSGVIIGLTGGTKSARAHGKGRR